MEIKSLEEYFDPYNVEHIKAYKHLSETGKWPEHFIPTDASVSSNINAQITAKLAAAWVHSTLHIWGDDIEDWEI